MRITARVVQENGVTTEWDSINPVNVAVKPVYWEVTQSAGPRRACPVTPGYYELQMKFRVAGKLKYTQWDKATPLTRIERHGLDEDERKIVKLMEHGNIRGALEQVRRARQKAFEDGTENGLLAEQVAG